MSDDSPKAGNYCCAEFERATKMDWYRHYENGQGGENVPEPIIHPSRGTGDMVDTWYMAHLDDQPLRFCPWCGKPIPEVPE